MSVGDLCTLMAVLPSSWLIVTPLTTVVDLPATTMLSGYFGVGLRCAQLPMWMCAGCGPAGAPLSEITTLRPAGVSASVAVPDSPEPFCGLRGTVSGALPIGIAIFDIESAATAGATVAPSTSAAPNAANFGIILMEEASGSVQGRTASSLSAGPPSGSLRGACRC